MLRITAGDSGYWPVQIDKRDPDKATIFSAQELNSLIYVSSEWRIEDCAFLCTMDIMTS